MRGRQPALDDGLFAVLHDRKLGTRSTIEWAEATWNPLTG